MKIARRSTGRENRREIEGALKHLASLFLEFLRRVIYNIDANSTDALVKY